MADHFAQGDGAEKNGRSRSATRVMAAVVAALVVVAGVAAWSLATRGGGGQAPTDDEVAPTVTEPSAGEPEDVVPGGGLPFSLEGVPFDAEVVEVAGEAVSAELAGEWSFGGDYVTIGSFPIDADTVFGSSASSPDDSGSYAASLIRSDGSVVPLEVPGSDDGMTWEPQDGSGDSSLVVWRSASLSFEPFGGYDNWRIQAWSEDSGASTVVGTAADLNGTDETPMLDAEVVPTTNGEQVFYASFHKAGEGWEPCVVAYDLADSAADAVVVGEGCYPAAVPGGVLWAGDHVEEEGALGYGALLHWDGTSSERVFTLSSDEGSWSISGVWASDGWRAVSLSSSDASKGSYIGIWDEGFETCLAWLHTPSPRVIASMNEALFVWGAGSELDNPGMYAFDFQSREVWLLGSAPGYSRPAVARDSNAVLVPECDGMSAATFRVGTPG